MAGITLTDAQDMLSVWLAAEAKVAQGQSYTIGSRSLTRADLSHIAERVSYWQGKVNELAGGGAGIRVRGITLGG